MLYQTLARAGVIKRPRVEYIPLFPRLAAEVRLDTPVGRPFLRAAASNARREATVASRPGAGPSRAAPGPSTLAILAAGCALEGQGLYRSSVALLQGRLTPDRLHLYLLDGRPLYRTHIQVQLYDGRGVFLARADVDLAPGPPLPTPDKGSWSRHGSGAPR